MPTDNKTDPGTANTGEPTVESLKAELAARDESIAALTKKHDSAFGKARLLETEVEDLKKKVSARETQDIANSGDIEKLRTKFAGELEASEAEKKKLLSQLHNVIVEKEVRGIASELAVDVEDVWNLTRDSFTVGYDDKGNPIPVVKDSALSPKTFLSNFLEKKPHLAKNPQVGGSGATKGDSSGGGAAKATTIPKDFGTWSQGDRTKWMKENPELAKEVVRGALG